jgi:hypothetical protein
MLKFHTDNCCFAESFSTLLPPIERFYVPRLFPWSSQIEKREKLKGSNVKTNTVIRNSLKLRDETGLPLWSKRKQ